MKFDKQAALVLRLYKATSEGKLEWKPSSRDEAFQVSFPSFTVVLSVTNQDETAIEVKSDEGDTIDSFGDPQLTNAELIAAPPGDAISWFQAMAELYRMARRTALGVDKALDDILKEIPE